MKTALPAAAVFFALHASDAGEVILPYSAFGPQAMACKLIGREWWQWQSHGGSRARDYPIKVVVFSEQTRDFTAGNHPVGRERVRDFRYVKCSKAVRHKESTIKELAVSDLDASGVRRGRLEPKKQRAGQGTPRSSPFVLIQRKAPACHPGGFGLHSGQA
jgi:hypothetical protein